MRILVISDSHDNLHAINAFKEHVKSNVDKYDLMVHLGDIISPFALRSIQSLGIRLIGVFGNNDGDRVLLKKFCPELSEQPLKLDVDGLRILLLHGWGSRETTDFLVNALARSNAFDLILYGHTHIANVRIVDKTLILNPGALSGYLTERPTYAVLDSRSGNVDLIDLATGSVLWRRSIPNL